MNTALTPEERRELNKWVSEANKPADNPWYMAGENGAPLDFITAWRTMLEMEEEHAAGR